jgi:hypothetical protein
MAIIHEKVAQHGRRVFSNAFIKLINMISVILFLSIVYIGHTLNLTDTDIKFTDIKTKNKL